MIEMLHREESDKLKNKAVYGFVKKPKVARPYLQKIGRILKKAAPVLLFSSLMTAAPVWRSVARSVPDKIQIENISDTLADLNSKSAVVDDIRGYINQRPDVELDISRITFGADDLAQMKGKGCAEAKAVERVAKTVRSKSGYCARAVKSILKGARLLTDCSEEDRVALLGVGSAWKMKPFFDNGCVKDFVKVNLDDDAAKEKKPVLMFRVNEQWDGVRRDANGKVVPNNAHVQAEGAGGYYWGQRNHSLCPSGHRDRTGRLHLYGPASYYMHKKDAQEMVANMAEKEEVLAIVDRETNVLTCFPVNKVPEQYQALVAMHKEQKNFNPYRIVQEADALRMEQPLLAKNMILPNKNAEQLQAKAGIKNPKPEILASRMKKSRIM